MPQAVLGESSSTSASFLQFALGKEVLAPPHSLWGLQWGPDLGWLDQSSASPAPCRGDAAGTSTSPARQMGGRGTQELPSDRLTAREG